MSRDDAANFLYSIGAVLMQPAQGFAQRQPLQAAIEARNGSVGAELLNLH